MLKLETERAEADKLARRFNSQMKKLQSELVQAKKKAEKNGDEVLLEGWWVAKKRNQSQIFKCPRPAYFF